MMERVNVRELWARGPFPTLPLTLAGLVLAALILAVPSVRSAEPEAEPEIVRRYGYRVEEKLAMDRGNFTQGLQVYGDRLYVGTGLYGESRLREYTFPAMELKKDIALPTSVFGEGIARYENRIYQLTWKSGRLFVYDADRFELLSEAEIDTEGWGLTHDGETLIYSDGTPVLRFLNPDSLAVTREITVTLAGRPLPRLNELEYIDGEVWANVWGANQLVRIDPDSGRVRAIVDLRGLLDPSERTPETDVLNGIAWDAEARALWVTGKRWPWLYRVRIQALPSV